MPKLERGSCLNCFSVSRCRLILSTSVHLPGSSSFNISFRRDRSTLSSIGREVSLNHSNCAPLRYEGKHERQFCSEMPELRRSTVPHIRGPGNVSTRELLSEGCSTEPNGEILSASRTCLRFVFPGPTPRGGESGRDLFRLRLFLFVFRQLAGARQEIYRVCNGKI